MPIRYAALIALAWALLLAIPFKTLAEPSSALTLTKASYWAAVANPKRAAGNQQEHRHRRQQAFAGEVRSDSGNVVRADSDLFMVTGREPHSQEKPQK